MYQEAPVYSCLVRSSCFVTLLTITQYLTLFHLQSYNGNEYMFSNFGPHLKYVHIAPPSNTDIFIP